MTKKYITLSIPVDSPEAEWLNGQRDRPRSFKQLVHMAQHAYGNQDLIDCLLSGESFDQLNTSNEAKQPKITKGQAQQAPIKDEQPTPQPAPTSNQDDMSDFKLPGEEAQQSKKSIHDLF